MNKSSIIKFSVAVLVISIAVVCLWNIFHDDVAVEHKVDETVFIQCKGTYLAVIKNPTDINAAVVNNLALMAFEIEYGDKGVEEFKKAIEEAEVEV